MIMTYVHEDDNDDNDDYNQIHIIVVVHITTKRDISRRGKDESSSEMYTNENSTSKA